MVVVGKMLALHFEHDDIIILHSLSDGEDEIGIDLFPAPALKSVMRACNVPVFGGVRYQWPLEEERWWLKTNSLPLKLSSGIDMYCTS